MIYRIQRSLNGRSRTVFAAKDIGAIIFIFAMSATRWVLMSPTLQSFANLDYWFVLFGLNRTGIVLIWKSNWWLDNFFELRIYRVGGRRLGRIIQLTTPTLLTGNWKAFLRVAQSPSLDPFLAFKAASTTKKIMQLW